MHWEKSEHNITFKKKIHVLNSQKVIFFPPKQSFDRSASRASICMGLVLVCLWMNRMWIGSSRSAHASPAVYGRLGWFRRREKKRKEKQCLSPSPSSTLSLHLPSLSFSYSPFLLPSLPSLFSSPAPFLSAYILSDSTYCTSLSRPPTVYNVFLFALC